MANRFFTKWKWHLILSATAIALLLAMEILLGLSRQGVIYPDCASYLESAKNLYVFHRGHNYRPMLLALINGFPYVFGASDEFVFAINRFVNFGCWIASILLLFEILKMFASQKMAFGISLGSIFLVGMPAFAFHLLSENVYLLFAMAGMYFLFRYFFENRNQFLGISLAIFLSAMLIRPGAKFFAILLVLYFMRELWQMRKSKAMFWIYGALAMIFVQCAGVKYQFGNFTISYIDAVTYYNYLGSKSLGIPIDQPGGQAKNPRNAYIFSHSCPEQKVIAAEDLKQQLTTNFCGLVKAYTDNLIGNSTSGNIVLEDAQNIGRLTSFEAVKSIFTIASKAQNILMTLLSVVIASVFFLRKGPFRIASSLILYTVFLSAISSEQGDRFHVVAFPFALVLLGKILSKKVT